MSPSGENPSREEPVSGKLKRLRRELHQRNLNSGVFLEVNWSGAGPVELRLFDDNRNLETTLDLPRGKPAPVWAEKILDDLPEEFTEGSDSPGYRLAASGAILLLLFLLVLLYVSF